MDMRNVNCPGGRFLMCRPEHFAVSYAINPWMDPASWARDERAHLAAAREWRALFQRLVELGAAVELVPPVPGIPDLVFTANAGVVLNRHVLLARFHHPERRREEPHFEAAFRALQAHGLIDSVSRLPGDVVLEGAGDCVFDAGRGLFWMGYGPRSDAGARRELARGFPGGSVCKMTVHVPGVPCIFATNRSAIDGVRNSPNAPSSAAERPSKSIATRPNTSRS